MEQFMVDTTPQVVVALKVVVQLDIWGSPARSILAQTQTQPMVGLQQQAAAVGGVEVVVIFLAAAVDPHM